ncbi:Hsp20/alpha crystallin family protein [Paenibacillus tuaregi]|uniref:Hsp20/alpha crystallin family protein n=1 Tax=Paenibacillus tuaregi TaxID=1816681 RepID=UPI00083901BF|nr:Hsp20/alpha crystallin family protein [Paenibacillus tuaregi]
MDTKKGINLEWLGEDPFFKNLFPFKDFKDQFKLDPSEVDKYVEDAISKAMSGNSLFDAGAVGSRKMNHEIMDTHHFIIAKIRVPRQIHPENLWVQVSRTQVKFSGHEEEQPQIITLAAPVNPLKSSATFKLGSLQVKMPKLKSGGFHDVAIRYL